MNNCSFIVFILVSLIFIPENEARFISNMDTSIVENSRDKKLVQRKSEIQKALLQISSVFAYSNDADIIINQVLEDIGKLCNAKRTKLFIFHEKEATVDNTHEWCSCGTPPQKQIFQAISLETLRWWRNRLQRRDIIRILDVSLLPEEASSERIMFEKAGIKSILSIPIFIDEFLKGFLTLDNITETLDWEQDDIDSLSTVSNLMTMALKRQRMKREVELAELNAELRQLNEEMKYVDEMKDNFLANVNHELKTPLTPIIGYSELLIEEYFGELNNKQKETLGTIVRHGEHLKRLIDSLLYLSSLQIKEFNYEINQLQLKNVIDKAVAILYLEKNEPEKKVLVNLPESLPLIEADKEYTTELFIHILDNAFKFTPSDGTILISSLVEKDCVNITISDNGVGIEKDKLARIFNVFYQGDSSKTRKYGGTGIGLHMCKKIIEDHGGEIKIESKENEGTVVNLRFPISRGKNKTASLHKRAE